MTFPQPAGKGRIFLGALLALAILAGLSLVAVSGAQAAPAAGAKNVLSPQGAATSTKMLTRTVFKQASRKAKCSPITLKTPKLKRQYAPTEEALAELDPQVLQAAFEQAQKVPGLDWAVLAATYDTAARLTPSYSRYRANLPLHSLFQLSKKDRKRQVNTPAETMAFLAKLLKKNQAIKPMGLSAFLLEQREWVSKREFERIHATILPLAKRWRGPLLTKKETQKMQDAMGLQVTFLAERSDNFSLPQLEVGCVSQFHKKLVQQREERLQQRREKRERAAQERADKLMESLELPIPGLGASSHQLACPTGSRDLGVVKSQYTGKLKEGEGSPKLRLCQLEGIAGQGDDASGSRRHGGAVVNSAVAPYWVALAQAAKADGVSLSAASSFRLGSSCGGGGDGTYCATPGGSLHQLGVAIDFNNMGLSGGGKGGSSCDAGSRATWDSKAYRWLKANAAQFGLYQYSAEAWHWDPNSQDASRCS